MKLKVYIPTCDSYLWLIKPFMFLFNKFWDDSIQVTYLGYNPPDFKLPHNCNFISLGKDDNLKNWSTDLKNYFTSIDDEYFIMTVDDSFLVHPTNTDLYTKIISYINTNSKIGRVGLERDLATRSHNQYDTFKGLNLVSASTNAANRISCRWSIWKKEYILKFLTPGRTPWSFEGEGTEQSKNENYDIISTPLSSNPPDNTIIFNTNCIWRDWYKKYNRLNFHSSGHGSINKGLDINIINDMKKQNLLPLNVSCGMIIEKKWIPIK
tara:strand:+ start:786 stop:1583 length:798 start_codon:yes stop_codon:yes gene_type:complete